MRCVRSLGLVLAGLIWIACHGTGRAAEVTVAVAANFVGTLETLQPAFEKESGHQLKLTPGATGKLYAQSVQGAPFDVFLSGDDVATRKLAEGGYAVPETEFTYALGTLALYSVDPNLLKAGGEEVLKEGSFRKLAIANPKAAPYGRAAEATLKALGIYDRVKGKLVTAENVGQTFAMIDTGNAELGFVALSQVLGVAGRGSHWIVPPSLYEPIRQNAIVLAQTKNAAAARAFLDFLKSTPAQELIGKAGYASD